MSIPKNMQGKYDEIAALIAPFCDEYLNDEYKSVVLAGVGKTFDLCGEHSGDRQDELAGKLLLAFTSVSTTKVQVLAKRHYSTIRKNVRSLQLFDTLCAAIC